MNKGLPVLLSMTILSGIALSSSLAIAENDEVIDTVELTVPFACTMGGTGQTSHNASINPGTYSGASGSDYETGIGKTTLTTFCNDNNGFSIYAIGFTGDLYEGETHTKLIGQNTNLAISTKVYTNGDTDSNWSMKVTKVDNPQSGDPVTYNPDNMSIQNSFNSWHVVPDTYTKVAQYNSNTTDPATTDTTLGAKIETTYATYISSAQAADTYTGQVKYVMVHPYDEMPLGPQVATSGCINYFPNGSNVEGTMGCQSATDGNDINLLASNFSRTGYGFAGWSDKFDYTTNSTARFYGPQETITVPTGTTANGLSLYAVWVPSAGSLQDTSKVSQLCGTGQGSLTAAPTDGTANLSSVSALTDQRDNQTYAIAKLADGKCWMIENLRLEAEGTRTAEKQALAQGYGTSTTYGNFGGLADAESTSFGGIYSANSLYSRDGSNDTINIGTTNTPADRMPRYNNWNNQSVSANRPQNPSFNSATNSTTNAGMYSYGNYYTWSAAMANTIYYNGPTTTDADGKTSETVNTSLCPYGWRLPYGRRTGNGATAGGFSFLDNRLGGTGSNSNSDTNPTGATMSSKWRSFPNNFLYSGEFLTSSAISRGNSGSYWSSTVNDEKHYSYYLYISYDSLYPGSIGNSKNRGGSIRCVVGI